MKDSNIEEPIEIERSKWHKPSYLGHYDEKATHYEGIRTRCLKCEGAFVFSAQEQKYAFEIERRYPGSLPSLCSTCGREWESIKQNILEYERSWEANRTALASDREFLREWLKLLKEAQPYRKKHFESRIRMLTVTIEGLALK